ncbi:MAG TPA: hypothetical protein VMU10_13145, partial [Desulfomonilia bacterium]|nr:hypothetical protein [Desulfomonilia bacterium]
IYPGNIFMKIDNIPGPLCILRGNITDDRLIQAAGICLRYSKVKGEAGHAAVYGTDPLNMDRSIHAPLFSEEYCTSLRD